MPAHILKADIMIVIPVYNPDTKMMDMIKALREDGFRKIVIVNDGSDASREIYFERAQDDYDCDVLTHAVHLGKGRSIKTAFNFILTHYPQCSGVITVDAMGQYSIRDIDRCSEEMSINPGELILGCRNFRDESIPRKSRVMNTISSKAIQIMCGIKVTDTTTGLRGLSKELVESFITVSGENFDYEMNQLLESKEKKVHIHEFPITVDYTEDNITSHFNPLVNSPKIYLVFLRYTATSIVAYIADLLLFTIFVGAFRNHAVHEYIMISTILARCVSATVNFFLTKSVVFAAHDINKKRAMMRFYFIAALQMMASAVGVTYVYKILPIAVTLVKVIIDALLFMLCFQIQREWVFKDKNADIGSSGAAA